MRWQFWAPINSEICPLEPHLHMWLSSPGQTSGRSHTYLTFMSFVSDVFPPECEISISRLMSRVFTYGFLQCTEEALQHKEKCSTPSPPPPIPTPPPPSPPPFHGWIYCQSVDLHWHVLEVLCKPETQHSSEAYSGFKEPAEGQRDGTGQQTRSDNLLLAQCSACRNEICLHILSTWSPRLLWRMSFTDGATTGVDGDSFLCLCIFTFASILSCSVNHRPVWAGRICAVVVKAMILQTMRNENRWGRA